MKKLLLDYYARVKKFSTPLELGPWAGPIGVYEQRFFANDKTFDQCLIELLSGSDNYSLINLVAQKEVTIDFYFEYFQRVGVDMTLLNAGEAQFLPEDLVSFRDGRRISTDLCRRVAHVDLIRRNIAHNPRPVVFEVGAGHGALARVLRLTIGTSTHIICDLPESLFFSAGFLLLSFPDARIALVDENNAAEIASNARNYDFIFVPVGLQDVFSKLTIDIFINTHSFGEMANDVIKRHFNFINENKNIKSVFLVNRFLNAHEPSSVFRNQGNFCSLGLDHSWDIEFWQVDPEFMQAASENYEPQYLCIVGSRSETNLSVDQRRGKSMKILAEVSKESWLKDAKVLFSPDAVARDLRHLLPTRKPSFVKGGTLFNLWNSIRIYRSAEGIMLMLYYLKYINYLIAPYAETIDYMRMYSELRTSNEDLIK